MHLTRSSLKLTDSNSSEQLKMQLEMKEDELEELRKRVSTLESCLSGTFGLDLI